MLSELTAANYFVRLREDDPPMKADRVSFEEPSESSEVTRKAENGFLCEKLVKKGQIFATVP